MRSTMHAEPQVSHRDSLADVRGVQAKADLRAQVSASDLPNLAQRAIKKAHGKMLTAGGVIGVSESQIGRLVNDGDLKLKQLEALGPETLAEFGKELVNEYAPLDTPKARAMRLLRNVREELSEVEQILEGVA